MIYNQKSNNKKKKNEINYAKAKRIDAKLNGLVANFFASVHFFGGEITYDDIFILFQLSLEMPSLSSARQNV